MNALHQHYRLLLGLDESCDVADVRFEPRWGTKYHVITCLLRPLFIGIDIAIAIVVLPMFGKAQVAYPELWAAVGGACFGFMAAMLLCFPRLWLCRRGMI